LKIKHKLRKYDFEKLREKSISVKTEEIEKLEESVNKMRAVKGRRLDKVAEVKENKNVKFVESECDLSESSLLKGCEYTWDIVQSKDLKEVKIRFDFKNKALVSLGDEPDYVIVKFWGAPFILSADSKPIFKEPFAIRVRIPLQNDSEDTSVIATQVFSDSAGTLGESIIWI
jgi:hypothetical protein